MEVNLVSQSMPTPQVQESLKALGNARDLIAYCARISNPHNQLLRKDGDRLIQYLIDNKHWSPFEMVSVCLEVSTTRDIARQLLRHRSFSFQEFSQRYADIGKLGESFEIREARMRDKTNRQSSLPCTNPELEEMWIAKQKEHIENAVGLYNWAIDNGMAKEQARVVLPEGNTRSRLYVNGTIRSWIHYIEIREHESTQKEHRVLATEIAKVIGSIYQPEG